MFIGVDNLQKIEDTSPINYTGDKQMQTKNLTKAQKMLIKTLKSGTSTLDDIRSHFHIRTISSLVKRDIIQINVKPVVKIK